ncbi:flagellar motor stator protein MotA [Effusibacillus dendaii]|uniref:Flagellar motor protein MotA n=1 Tax=Effusibacillus dendaii TaxID=2743772 RepID=A0A7I8DD21_9BACL|nr:flagellar motor stator protein MotA [Effusibacillus dendaii]BCJ88004.1 flagellar motor protein MotA [Effusibacillus dendaii]
MDKSSVIGIILGVIAVGTGMVLKGASLSALVNPAAFLIILVGTTAAVLIAFPMKDIKKIPKLFKMIFTEQKLPDKKALIKQLSEWASVARREGILSLEEKVLDYEDPFVKKGMQMVIDGGESDYIRAVLEEEIAAMEERHAVGAQIFSQAGAYAPTLGVLGAVVGLISALGNLKNVEQVGHSISAAFIATLLGIFTGYVLWHPFANKLKRKSKEEIELKIITMEGILSIQSGETPQAIEEKLLSYLPVNERSSEESNDADAVAKEIEA